MTANSSGEPQRSCNEQERQEKIRRATDFSSEYNNPCLKEYKMSSTCLMQNTSDKDKCSAYFANYRTCRDFWDRIKADRRAKGIRPHLPVPEEREAIKAEYVARKKQ